MSPSSETPSSATRLPPMDLGSAAWHRQTSRMLHGLIIAPFVVAAGVLLFATTVEIQVVATAPGVIESPTRPVRASASGIVRHVYFATGDTVRAGSRLVELDTRELQRQRGRLVEQREVLSLESSLLRAQSDRSAAEAAAAIAELDFRLHAQRGELRSLLATFQIDEDLDAVLEDFQFGRHAALDVSVAELMAVEAARARAVAGVTSDERDLELATIEARLRHMSVQVDEIDAEIADAVVRAPAFGIVTADDPDRLPGESVSEGTVLAEVIQPGWIARLSVAEDDVHRIRVGDEARLTVPAIASLSWTGRVDVGGRVTSVSHAPTPQGGTASPRRYEVLVELDDEALEHSIASALRPGYSASGELISDRAGLFPVLASWIRRRVLGR